MKNPIPVKIEMMRGAIKMGEFHPEIGPWVRERLKHTRVDMIKRAPRGSRASQEKGREGEAKPAGKSHRAIAA
jgi:hypothetical protein